MKRLIWIFLFFASLTNIVYAQNDQKHEVVDIVYTDSRVFIVRPNPFSILKPGLYPPPGIIGFGERNVELFVYNMTEYRETGKAYLLSHLKNIWIPVRETEAKGIFAFEVPKKSKEDAIYFWPESKYLFLARDVDTGRCDIIFPWIIYTSKFEKQNPPAEKPEEKNNP